MTSKQRAYLRKEANTLDAVFQIGKNGIDKNLIKGLDEVITARELIKVTVHETSEFSARELAQRLASSLDGEIVQVIGRKIVLYRRNRKIGKYGV